MRPVERCPFLVGIQQFALCDATLMLQGKEKIAGDVRTLWFQLARAAIACYRFVDPSLYKKYVASSIMCACQKRIELDGALDIAHPELVTAVDDEKITENELRQRDLRS